MPETPKKSRAAILLAFISGAALCALFVWMTDFGQAFRERVVTTRIEPSPTPTSAPEPKRASPTPQPSATPVKNPQVISPSPELLAALQQQRLQDVNRSADEEIGVLANLLSLSPDQQAAIKERLVAHRLATIPPQGSEQQAITELLSPEQKARYSEYLENNRRADAEQSAAIRLHSVESVTGPLSGEQKDTIFANFLDRDINEQVVSDADILRLVLTPEQFALWSKSRFAAPEEIPDGK
jgi:hypothetical protein